MRAQSRLCMILLLHSVSETFGKRLSFSARPFLSHLLHPHSFEVLTDWQVLCSIFALSQLFRHYFWVISVHVRLVQVGTYVQLHGASWQVGETTHLEKQASCLPT